MKLPNIDTIKKSVSNYIKIIKIKFSKLNAKEKNNLILLVSAGLIVLAVIIAIIGNVASKTKKEEPTSPAQIQETVDQNNATDKDDNDPTTSTIGSNGGIYKVATQNDPLTIRINPSASSDSVDGIPKGSEIEILGVYEADDGSKFGFVIVNGASGWVNMKYTEYISASTTKTSHGPGKYIVNSSDGVLSVRRRPDDSNLGTGIPNGTEVEIISVCSGQNCEWGLVDYNGEVGWLPFTYLK